MFCRTYINGSLADDEIFLDLSADDSDIPFITIYENQKRRNIHKCVFEDKVWEITNGYDSREIIFSNVLTSPLGWSKEEYINILKKETVGLIDKRSITSVASCISFIIEAGNSTQGFRKAYKQSASRELVDVCSEFLEALEIEPSELFLPELITEAEPGSTRDLAADFWTYYVFDWEIKEFWKNASDDQKITYGPLYLFWELCCVLPTRPKGFCLMPRNPIFRDRDGKCYIRTRQSGIKGKGKRIENCILLDYLVAERRITERIASLFEEYQSLIENDYGEFDNDCLFCNNAFNRINHSNLSSSFKTSHLNTLKEKFICEVLQKDKSYKIRSFTQAIEDISYLDTKWITNWNLADLRHLAMIDMVLRGVSPAVIMELAGQENIASACHYFNNSINLNRSRLRFIEQNRLEYSSVNSDWHKIVESTAKPIEGGYCHLVDVSWEEKVEICFKHEGRCEESACPYFEPERGLIEKERSILQRKITRSSELLAYYRTKKDANKLEMILQDIQDDLKKEEELRKWERHEN